MAEVEWARGGARDVFYYPNTPPDAVYHILNYPLNVVVAALWLLAISRDNHRMAAVSWAMALLLPLSSAAQLSG
eukprot:604810-Hanusia_phi.AAC.1